MIADLPEWIVVESNALLATVLNSRIEPGIPSKDSADWPKEM